MFGILTELLKRYFKSAYISLIPGILNVILGVYLLFLIKNNYISGLYGIILTFSLGVFFSFTQEFLLHRTAHSIGIDLRRRVTENLVFTTSSIYSQHHALENSQWITTSVISLLRSFSRRYLQILIFGSLLLYLNWKLTLILMLALPLIGFSSLYLGKLTAAGREHMFNDDSLLYSTESSILQNKDIIKTMGSLNQLSDFHKNVSHDFFSSGLRYLRINSIISPVSLLIFILMLVTSLIFFRGGNYTLGEIFSFIAGLTYLYNPLSGISSDTILIINLLNMPVNLFTKPDLNLVSEEFSSLRIDNLSFTYDKNTVLTVNNLLLKKGNCLIITGNNGAGKSTLIKIICGLLPAKGIVFNDDVSLRNIKVAYSPQKPEVFFRDSLFTRNPGSTDFNINEFDNMIALFKIKHLFDRSPINFTSDKLSPGEKKKISLCRVFSYDRNLLVFDEPTSGLDSDSISVFVEQIDKSKKLGKSIIITTHDRTFSDYFKNCKSLHLHD
ncbi:MAG: ABC transporter ATP-binding protein [Deltaproteobacteria bacterium]|nr:ABC transporter ATP-binding protein [Deltaproteobacteria bacterium]